MDGEAIAQEDARSRVAARHAGKVALVTGGARGIGAGIVRLLAEEGASVTFTYLTAKAEAETLVAQIEDAGGSAEAIAADNGDRAQMRAVIDELTARTGRLDIVVANAAGGTLKPVHQLTDAEVDRAIDVSIRGTLDTIRFSLPHLRDGGRIITIGSVAAHNFPTDRHSLYGMTKGAIASLVRGLSRELGPRGITINNVQPGPVRTPSNPGDGPAADIVRARIATGRFGEVAEIAAFVSYLAAAEGAFINGASLDIDGGYSA